MYTFKVMIHPNNKQMTKIRRTLNKCIECNNIIYDYLDSFLKNNEKIPSCGDVRKWFTIQKSIKDNEVIEKRKGLTKKEMISNHLDTLFYDVSNDALKQEIKDTYNSFIRYFKKLSKYPVKKKNNNYKKSFYVDPYKIGFSNKKVRLEKISNNKKPNRQRLNCVNMAEKDRIPLNANYYNPRVVLEGDRFYIVVSVDDEYAPKKKITTTDSIIGIDLNIKAVVTSDNDIYKSVTVTKRYRKALKKEKRAQRKLSRKYLQAKTLKKSLKESKNYIKQRKIKTKYTRRLRNLEESYFDYVITSLKNKRPKEIIIEDLDVKEMKESDNKYVRKGLQRNPFSKLLKALENRCNNYGILIRKVDRYYASSKTCNICGYKKTDLKLSDRTFICPNCGLKIDRDYNAAINIKKYALVNN
ncbi:MAG: transposase [Acholeplasmatales bacterium]|nr:transposase [Acholeplasmatales bacterium]